VSVVQQIQQRTIADYVTAQIKVQTKIDLFHRIISLCDDIFFYDTGIGQWKSNRRRIAC
jgi:hypothetical protein